MVDWKILLKYTWSFFSLLDSYLLTDIVFTMSQTNITDSILQVPEPHDVKQGL